MNLFLQYCFLVVLAVLVLEVIETGEAYKLIRPYKYYRRRPRPPRWHKGHRSSKFYHSKRIPPEDYYSRRPGYYRHSTSEDFDSYVENKPYTIVIQLLKGEDKYSHNDYLDRKRNYDRDPITAFASESDYIDDVEDYESKVFNINNKKVHINMIKGENPKLHIKISRSDVDKDIEIVDKSNITAVNLPLLTKADANLTLLPQQTEENWTSADPFTVYPENIQEK